MKERSFGFPGRRLIGACSLIVAGVAFVISMYGVSAAAAAPPKLTLRGGVNMSALSGNAIFNFNHLYPNEVRPAGQEPTAQDGNSGAPPGRKHKSRFELPDPRGSSVVTSNRDFSGFNGLNHFDQRFAGTDKYANTQFSLEPPDQGLCVGAGYVVETVNTAIRVDSNSGVHLTSAIPINQFLSLAPEMVRATGAFGDFVSDPKCYFDVSTQRWFFTVVQLGVHPADGSFDGTSKEFIAVSKTSNPAADWNVYSFDTSNDFGSGTCPCFGDQPLLGADQYGVYISTNSFPIFTSGFNGAVIYAISKSQLVAGSSAPTVVTRTVPTLAEGQAYSLQPATTPTGKYETRAGGTEYFLSALEFTGTGDTRIAAWALTNTGSLDSTTPNLTLTNDVVRSESYVVPPLAEQKSGSTPLRECVNNTTCSTALLGGADPFAPEPLAPLNTNDDRMNQVVFADGLLWSGVNTAVKQRDGVTRAGIAWFAVEPRLGKKGVKADIDKQGYVSVDGAHVFFPSIGVNDNGSAVMTFTLSGTGYFPSAAYVILPRGDGGDPPDVHIASAGLGPADGFTGYRGLDAVDNGVERWGDYSAAVAAADGSIWLATEYIAQTCTLDQFLHDTTCGGTRSAFANWGSFIGHVTLQGDDD